MHTFLFEPPAAGTNASPAAIVASLVPAEAQLPESIFGKGAAIATESAYPFSDNATITLTAGPIAAAIRIRIPGWATAATVNGAPAANGTLVTVACKANLATSATVELNPEVRLEYGWGNLGVRAGQGCNYTADPAGATLTTTTTSPDCSRSTSLACAPLEFAGGAELIGSKTAGAMDVRSGGPGHNSTVTVLQPMYGGDDHNQSHYIEGVSMSFKYISGYGPKPGQPKKKGSQIALVLIDASSHKELQQVWISAPLDKFNYDNFTGYSPLQHADVSGLKVPNSRPVLLQLKLINNERNLQVQLDPTTGFNVHVHWSAAVNPEPPSPRLPFLNPPTNGVIALRGPLLFALHPQEDIKVVQSYEKLLPTRPHAVDYEISTNNTWNYALQTGTSAKFVNSPTKGWSASLPFATEEYPFYLTVQARQVPQWGYWEGSKITDTPPSSPIDCSAANAHCGVLTELKLVPFGGTNIRISVFPWTA
jgi:hypothetical protein